MRVVEEAIEIAQAFDITVQDLHNQIDRTYSRPVGDKALETAGTTITLIALARSQGWDLNALTTEMITVLENTDSAPRRKKQQEKHSLGLGLEPK